MAQVLRQLSRPSAVTVALVVIVLAMLKIWWPTISKEFSLQYHCHLNDTHLAQENTRLAKKIKELRNEVNAVGEEKKQCLNDNDMEHSAANRSYWDGVWACICAEMMIISLLACWCCCLTICIRAPQAHQRNQNLAAIG